MTEKDKKLIAEANGLRCIEWYKAFDFAEQADTKEAAERLHAKGLALHCEEECRAGDP